MEIPCFVEDDAHEAFLKALLTRLAALEGWPRGSLTADFRSSSGGSRLKIALRSYFQDVRRGLVPGDPLLVVLIDGNCNGRTAQKRFILEQAERSELSNDQLVIGVPDPHVERWLLDARALRRSVDPHISVEVIPYKCERGRYKGALREAFQGVGIFPPAGGVEYSSDILEFLDLEHPACGDAGLPEFVDDLRRSLRRLHRMVSSN